MEPRAEEVARYLKDHPEFFEHYAELLASLHIPHPHGGRAIPLSERQMLTLREKGRALEGKLRELVRVGEENETIGERLHRFTLAMMSARDLVALLDCVEHNLREEFAVPAVALRLWSVTPEDAELGAISEEAREFADGLAAPYFAEQPMADTAAWFDAPKEALRSLVYIPLRAERSIGVLVLASDDPQRFSTDLGTLYLARLGELVGAALHRYARR
ncbi:MAG TPA: DUF484 family protein [Burkholderiales bacterium]|nr:DUF484 family protein [Burkholderiales bacterium]